MYIYACIELDETQIAGRSASHKRSRSTGQLHNCKVSNYHNFLRLFILIVTIQKGINLKLFGLSIPNDVRIVH